MLKTTSYGSSIGWGHKLTSVPENDEGPTHLRQANAGKEVCAAKGR